MSQLDVPAATERWREILASTGSSRTLLAALGSRVVGFASLGDPLANARPGTAWLYAIYVDASFLGTGVGHLLHEAGLESLRASGFSRVELWVLRGNDRAIAFYERHGWVRDGREQLDDHLPGVQLEEIGLSRPL